MRTRPATRERKCCDVVEFRIPFLGYYCTVGVLSTPYVDTSIRSKDCDAAADMHTGTYLYEYAYCTRRA